MVRELSAAQGGVFRRSDLASWGIDPTVAVTMLRSGAWRRLHHGVYADSELVSAATSPAQRHALMAAATLSALPGDVALFAPSAAVLLGLAVDRGCLTRVHLVRPPGSDSRALRRRISADERLPHAVIHVLDVPEELLTTHNGLRMVNADLAACGTAMLEDVDWAVATLDGIAWQDEHAVARLTEVSELWPRMSGIGTLRAALPLVRTGAQTPLESLSRVKLVRCGLPEPELQVPMYDDEGLIGVVDMHFASLGVVGEADGDVKYDKPSALIDEKRREDRIRAKGRPVVRWGWPQAMGTMRSTAKSVWQASHFSYWRRAS